MKKLLTAILLSLAAVCLFAAGGLTALAEGPAWTSDGNATVTAQSGYDEVSVEAGTTAVLTYGETLNFNEGATLRYLIPRVTDFDIDVYARTNGSNYVKVTVLNPQNQGIELKIYALASRTNSKVAKMETDVTYLDPAIEASETDITVTDGRHYLESFSTYEPVEGASHYIDLHREQGLWYFAVDGLSALPVTDLADLDLSACTVTMEVYSQDVDATLRLYPVEGARYSFTDHNWMQLGSDIITELPDDTVRYKVADQRAAEFPGSEIRYREQLISTVAYDVRQPITIEYSYDVANASAVWYAVGLGRPDVLASITKHQYDVNNARGQGVDNVISSYSDSLAAQNDGIMFQTTTGLAQPTYRDQNDRLAPYTTNSPSTGYNGRSSMDTLTFIVKENGTDMYHNGTLIFEDLVTKLSDFESNGYMAYPYFHFFEDNANTTKGNTIVIKGVNAAKRTDDSDLRIVGGSGQDLVVGLSDCDNGEISLFEPVDGGMQAVDASLYSYDKEAQTLTVSYDYFDGKAYEVYNLYARNNSGSEEITVRFSDPTLATQPPTVEQSSYTWIKGGTEDLVIKEKKKNGTYDGFSGGGILRSQYTYTQDEGATTGTITISSDYLNGRRAGTFTYTLRTTNVEEETFSVQFTIVIQEEGGELPPEEDSEGEGTGGGCGGSQVNAGGTALMLGMLTLAGSAFLIRRRSH